MKNHFNMPDLQPMQQEVDEFLYNFQSITITTKDEYTQAADIIKQIQVKVKKLEEKRLEYTRPLDESKKAIMSDFKKVTDPLDQFIADIKEKMLTWYRQEQKRLDEEQKRIDAEALKNAKEQKISEVTVPVVNKELKTQRGEVATVTIKKVWKWKIADQNKIPKEYLCVDAPAIVQAIRSGVRFIEGIEIYQEEQAPSIR